MKFLCTTIHPRVRTNVEKVSKLIEIFNKHLSHDGYEIVKTDEISGRPVFSGRRKAIGQARLEEKRAEIKRYLNTAYLNGKISTMTVAIASDTDLAIGIAKELLTLKTFLTMVGVMHSNYDFSTMNWEVSDVRA